MVLAMDIGNTNIVLGVIADDRFVATWRIATDKQKTADEYAVLLKELFGYSGLQFEQIKDVIISNVVPPLTITMTRMSEKYLGLQPLFVDDESETGIVIKYSNPKEIGADRIVNAAAAQKLYGGPLIIVDFGTATTFCALTADGEYLGGAIAPGIGISTEALFSRAAKLPRVELIKPESIVCQTTTSSIQAGIIYGFVGQVEGIVRRMKILLGDQTKVIATGGLASLIAAETDDIDIVEPDLTLEGLRLIYRLNRENSGVEQK